MAQVAEQYDTLTAAFDAFRREAAFGPAPLAALREAAFSRFLAHGFPTTRQEEWRATNIAPIASTAFGRPAAAAVAPSALEPYLLDGAILHRVVMVNGRFSPALSSLAGLPAGVTVTSLRESFDRTGGRDAASALLPGVEGQTALVDVNLAFVEDGVVIDVAPKAVIAEPIHILSIASVDGPPAMICPRVLVRAGEQSEVSLVESYAGVSTGVAFTNAVTQIVLAPSAVVDHVKFQREPATAFHLASIFVRLERAATFTSHAVTLGGRIARNDIIATLAGEGAECTLDGLYVADGDALVDTHTTIDHAQPHCPSHEVYKGILSGRARAVFNGKIIVRQDAQKTDAKQTNKALLLSDEAQINTKPQLEIFADDVKCTHGAAIGQLDEDAMFYLQARGISALEARNLLIHAFAGEVLDGVKEEVVRERAMRLLEEKLSLWKV
jgi:Fe-S cluster assembly protein SufD